MPNVNHHPPASPASPASTAAKDFFYAPPLASGAPLVTATSLSVAGAGVASSTTGAWSGNPTFTYAWTRDGAAISGATAATYTLVAADVGHNIGCTVTATNSSGTASKASNTVGPVTA
jgi:hypothetical protein